MGSFSVLHWAVVLLVVMLLFGGGKVSGLMGEFAQGIKSFKKNMAADDDAPDTLAAHKASATIPAPGSAAGAHAPAGEHS